MFEWLKRKTKDNAIADDEINPLPDKDKRLLQVLGLDAVALY